MQTGRPPDSWEARIGSAQLGETIWKEVSWRKITNPVGTIGTGTRSGGTGAIAKIRVARVVKRAAHKTGATGGTRATGVIAGTTREIAGIAEMIEGIAGTGVTTGAARNKNHVSQGRGPVDARTATLSQSRGVARNPTRRSTAAQTLTNR